MEKELRALISFTSNLMDWAVRDKFARVLQVATLLSLTTVSAVSLGITSALHVSHCSAKITEKCMYHHIDTSSNDTPDEGTHFESGKSQIWAISTMGLFVHALYCTENPYHVNHYRFMLSTSLSINTFNLYIYVRSSYIRTYAMRILG